MKKKTWAIAFAGALAVAVVGAGVVMAQTPPSGGTGTSFLDRVAQKLGIDTPKLQTAIKDARTDQIDQSVANGDLTQKQADALKNKIANSPDGLGFGGPGGRGFGPGEFGKGGPLGFAFGLGFGPGMNPNDAAQMLADFLGISADQLKTELGATDATLATVAGAHGKSRDDLKSFITSGAKTKLDAAVANGDLTQKREDEALAALTAHLDTFIDGKFGFGGGGHGFKFRFGGPGGGAKPGAAPGTPGQSGTSANIFRS